MGVDKRAARTYTVGCRLHTLVPDERHRDALEDAVHRVHRATFLATELANMHLRRCVQHDMPVDDLFSANWLYNVYNEVTVGKGAPAVADALHQTRAQCMPPFEPPSRTGVLQCIMYECRNLAAVAATNVWMHFSKRVRSHVRHRLALDDDAYGALTSAEKRERRLLLLTLAHDLVKRPDEDAQAPEEHRAWVDAERGALGIDAAVGSWQKRPLLYHLKARPHRFVAAMARMSAVRERSGGSAFALFPLRRTYVPRHVRFDQKALRDLLKLGGSEHTKKRAKRQHATRGGAGASNPTPLDPNTDGVQMDAPAVGKKRVRRAADELLDEKAELFGRVVDLRAAKVRRAAHFDFAFTTDGVCARVQMQAPSKGAPAPLTSMPARGVWAIDELKRVSRLDALHVVGVDPGKRELVVGVDMDDPKGCAPVRYTQAQRAFETRSKQYKHEGERDKPALVAAAEARLSGHSSRSASLDTFSAYCTQRHEGLEAAMAFYAHVGHRRRRWKAVIKTQQSEERLYERFGALRREGDPRALVLAYGSWGLVAGQPGAACNRGNAPCIGVGLMRKLAKRFVVAVTPEAWTSKTCCKCLGACGPWRELEAARGTRIRGLRLCQTEDCRLRINRDRNGATNIGTNFKRLFEGRNPIRSMSEEGLRLHRLFYHRRRICRTAQR